MTPACLQGQCFLLLQRVRQVQGLRLVGGGGRSLVEGVVAHWRVEVVVHWWEQIVAHWQMEVVAYWRVEVVVH